MKDLNEELPVSGWCERCAEEVTVDRNGECPDCGCFVAHIPVPEARR